MRKAARLSRYLTRLVVAALLALVALSQAPSAPSHAADPVVFFSDDFDGTGLDPTKWNTGIAVGGERWCEQDGIWKSVSAQLCFGSTLSVPYGDYAVEGGQFHLRGNQTNSTAYIWSGPPNISPFPAAGDFAIEVRIGYDNLLSHGAGFGVAHVPATGPVGTNPPPFWSQATLPLGVWGDASALRANVFE